MPLIITKSSNAKRLLLKDFEKLPRKLICKFHYNTGENSPLHPFKTKSGFMLDLACRKLEDYILILNKTGFFPLKFVITKSNISKSEREAILSLKHYYDIVIKNGQKQYCCHYEERTVCLRRTLTIVTCIQTQCASTCTKQS